MDPVIWNERTGHVVGGHQRLEVMKEMGATEVEVSVVDLPEDKEKALNVALNKISGEWDQDKLVDLLHELGDMVELTGFDAEELDKLFDNKTDVQEDDFDADAALADITEPITKRGDIYQLGRHRLMCGDSTAIDMVEKLMAGQKADCVVTDPPYNTGMQGKSEPTWLAHFFNDSIENWPQFLSDCLGNMNLVTKGECAFYVFIDWRRVADIKAELEKLMDVKNVIVWDKQVHGLGSDYKFTYELCVVGKKGKPKINNRFGLDYQDIWRVQRQMGRNKDHATAKPIELLSKPIKHASKQDDIVLDLFGGSGSTMMACEQLNRICYMMELDEKYCDVIIKRWEDFTGQKAELIS